MRFQNTVIVLTLWYLMGPPLNASNPKLLDYQTPRAQWELAGVFDDAANCLRTRFQMMAGSMRYLECLESDDPRLKGRLPVAPRESQSPVRLNINRDK
jgi:hypothetical protein